MDFDGLASSGVEFYRRESDADGNQVYAKASADDAYEKNLYLGGGKWIFGDALVYSRKEGAVGIRFNNRNGTLGGSTLQWVNLNGSSTSAIEEGGTVKPSDFNSYILVKSPAAGTVAATVKSVDSSQLKKSGAIVSNAAVAFADINGKILATQKIDNLTSTEYTLSCRTDGAKTLYLVFSKNGDNGGGVNVFSINYMGENSEKQESITIPFWNLGEGDRESLGVDSSTGKFVSKEVLERGTPVFAGSTLRRFPALGGDISFLARDADKFTLRNGSLRFNTGGSYTADNLHDEMPESMTVKNENPTQTEVA